MAPRGSHSLFAVLLLLASPGGVSAAEPPNVAAPESTSTRPVLPGTQAYEPARPDLAPRAMLTDPYAVFSVPQVPKPAYLAPFTDPTFGSPVERVGNSAGGCTLKWRHD